MTALENDTWAGEFDIRSRLDETEALCRAHSGVGRAALGRLLGGMQEIASQGAWVTVHDGRRFLNFGGHGVYLLGHRHPVVTAAVHRQIDEHPMSTRVFFEPVAIHAAADLAAVAPAGLDLVHFVNSGAEATEAALKLARAHGKSALVTTHNGFHGKTLGALSVTARRVFQEPFEPLLPDVTVVPYGDADALDTALAAVAGRGVFIVEPVQGEGGVIVPPAGYLAAAADSCRRHDVLLIVDEIQTGLGRLGSWWGVDDEGVTPDIMLVGKGLSGGVVPIGAVVTTAQLYAPFAKDPYLHSSTFAASPIACAAASAAIRALRAENIVSRAAGLGERLIDAVREIVSSHPGSGPIEVRGRGLLIGIEFPEPGLVGDLYLNLVDRGVLVNHSLNSPTVLRLTPPAVLSADELDLFTTVFAEALAQTLSRSAS
ncbi:aspartate aminotransferase family protein [Nocardia sp. CDC153]|uniref:aspartate aminotransferase family protein n=1 Tax=Nocardia sp. CDC153 TaxID=3112167 RepID=UPI002DB7DD00|nr:aspartate aminotransferase family protein [Nocardia sp. CDC153]MEC3956859.1 aspartate aminotransferase family protein [Nocardia sp. CDC153]